MSSFEGRSGQLDGALSNHIVSALMEMEEAGVPHFGKRKVVSFLQGKTNANTLELRLHELSSWGTIPFISVRNLQAILEGMISCGAIEVLESPRIGKPVLRASRRSGGSVFSIQSVFPTQDWLIKNMSEEDIELFQILREARAGIARDKGVSDKWNANLYMTRLIKDKELMSLARWRPESENSLLELLNGSTWKDEYRQYMEIIRGFKIRKGNSEGGQ